MQFRNHYILFVVFLFFFSSMGSFAQSQSKKDLENKKKELQKEIDYQNKLLDEVKKNKNRSMVQLAILNNKIVKQQSLIALLNSEIETLGKNINETRKNIQIKESEMNILKNDYAKIIFASYKNRDSYQRLMFLFASSDFNQGYQRIKYFQYYADARKKQAGLIQETQRQLETKKQELEIEKEEHNKALNEKEKERGKLSKEKKDKEVVLTDLQKREKKIKDELKKKKEASEKLKKAIEKVIDAEIKKSREGSKKDSKKITLTPDEQVLSDDFQINKGHLPWPLAEGVITESFGTHAHPDLPGIKITNNGVNIGTNKGATVRAVFNGTVVAVASVGGVDGKVVIVKHGEYLSVYSNLAEAHMKSGDKIKTKQSIGKVLTDDNSVTELHFEIWKGQTMMNPESWIAK